MPMVLHSRVLYNLTKWPQMPIEQEDGAMGDLTGKVTTGKQVCTCPSSPSRSSLLEKWSYECPPGHINTLSTPDGQLYQRLLKGLIRPTGYTFPCHCPGKDQLTTSTCQVDQLQQFLFWLKIFLHPFSRSGISFHCFYVLYSWLFFNRSNLSMLHLQ